MFVLATARCKEPLSKQLQEGRTGRDKNNNNNVQNKKKRVNTERKR